MLNKIMVQQYYKEEIILSNNQIIKGSTILTDDGEVFSLKIEETVEEFLANEKNYKFLEIFKSKEIFLVGCGENFIIPSLKIRKLIHEKKLKLEWVTTRIALQVFNILVEDDRSCFALLINEIKSL